MFLDVKRNNWKYAIPRNCHFNVLSYIECNPSDNLTMVNCFICFDSDNMFYHSILKDGDNLYDITPLPSCMSKVKVKYKQCDESIIINKYGDNYILIIQGDKINGIQYEKNESMISNEDYTNAINLHNMDEYTWNGIRDKSEQKAEIMLLSQTNKLKIKTLDKIFKRLSTNSFFGNELEFERYKSLFNHHADKSKYRNKL